MKIEDMKKIVDRVTNTQKTQKVRIDINGMPDGFKLTTFDETGMIKRVYISEREGVGDAICTIERLEKCINSYKERKKESMEKMKKFLKKLLELKSKRRFEIMRVKTMRKLLKKNWK